MISKETIDSRSILDSVQNKATHGRQTSNLTRQWSMFFKRHHQERTSLWPQVTLLHTNIHGGMGGLQRNKNPCSRNNIRSKIDKLVYRGRLCSRDGIQGMYRCSQAAYVVGLTLKIKETTCLSWQSGCLCSQNDITFNVTTLSQC